MKKKIISALVSAALATTMLAGCGNGSNGGTSNKEEGKGGTTVTMTGWYTEENMAPVLEKVNKMLDGKYTVEYTYINLDEYNNVISTQLAAGEGPDILTDGTNFPARIKAGNLKDLTGAEYLNGINEAGLTLSTSEDGKVYGIPSYGWFSGLWYNKEIFEKNNITELPQTFDEFVAVCDKLKAAGVQPLGFGLADGDQAMHSLMGYIENTFYQTSEEGKKFDEEFSYGEKKMDGTLNKYVKDWSILIEKGYITPEMVGTSNEQALSNFISGKTAMFNAGPWYYANLKDANMNVGMMPHLGKTADVKYMLGGPAASFGINVNTKNEEGSEAVMAALASVEIQQAFADANEGSFSYKEGVKVDMPAEYEAVKPVLEAGNVACSWERWGVNMPAQTLVDELLSQLQGLVTGDLTVDDFVKALDSRADAIRYKN
ncbi:ABC transporter substrate-binding protein [Clostridium nigeriense]|uniref:ABC transporter substrate-binding protein n=1 Tax=Clostridium nigeriense TaxID=1805470 RepID=UPI000834AE26|nr:extracellular solute-binding protein [Clostridium nigeriense]